MITTSAALFSLGTNSEGPIDMTEAFDSAEIRGPSDEVIRDTILDNKPAWVTGALATQESDYSTNGKYTFKARAVIASDAEVHEYVTASGVPGYVLMQYETRVDGEYRRQQNFGPETHRNQGWRKVVAPDF